MSYAKVPYQGTGESILHVYQEQRCGCFSLATAQGNLSPLFNEERSAAKHQEC